MVGGGGGGVKVNILFFCDKFSTDALTINEF